MSVTIRNLTIVIGGKTIVSHVDLDIADGERVGLIGSSGSGKSMIAKAMMGLLPAPAQVSGSIEMGGRRIVGATDADIADLRGRYVGMVFQNPAAALNPVMSVEEILAEPLEIWGLLPRGKERRDVLERLLHRVGMDASALCRQPAELSGGQRQRVAIARAVAVHPDLVIADEPVASLDVSMQAQIVTLFQQVQQEQGFSFLYISHDLAMVRYLCDRVGVMRSGRLVEEAEADELFAHPCHAYTRVLLSAMPEPDPRYERARTILSCDEEELGTTFEEVSPGHRVLR